MSEDIHAKFDALLEYYGDKYGVQKSITVTDMLDQKFRIMAVREALEKSCELQKEISELKSRIEELTDELAGEDI